MDAQQAEPLIRNLWVQNAAHEFAFRKADELTGEQVREFMRGTMETLSPRLHGDPLFLFVYWKSLNSDQRAAVLAELFPDGETYRRENYPLPAD